MRKRTQEERILDMIKRPVPRKRVGIVHLEMVRESRTLYGMKRFQNPREAAEMVRPLCEKADREMVLVLSLNGRLEPQAVEIAAVGGISSCSVDIRSLFKHALLNNAEFVICVHNHPSGDPGPSREDEEITGRIRKGLDGGEGPDPEAIELVGFDQKLERRQEIDETMKLLETEKRQIDQEIKVFMDGHETADSGRYRVTWREVISSRLDTKRLKEEKPDIYREFLQESKSSRFTVKVA